MEAKRKEMYYAYMVKNNYSEALIKSQKLDNMLNKYRKLCQSFE
ncbi:aspartyl-phosphate phosphatase Spo0E family protein [Halobacillus sp. HZG1]